MYEAEEDEVEEDEAEEDEADETEEDIDKDGARKDLELAAEVAAEVEIEDEYGDDTKDNDEALGLPNLSFRIFVNVHPKTSTGSGTCEKLVKLNVRPPLPRYCFVLSCASAASNALRNVLI